MLLDPKSVSSNRSSKDAALYVAGVKLAEGTESEMRKLFDSEVAGHKAAVELRVYEADGYRVALRRRA